jgi:hypothetical protein
MFELTTATIITILLAIFATLGVIGLGFLLYHAFTSISVYHKVRRLMVKKMIVDLKLKNNTHIKIKKIKAKQAIDNNNTLRKAKPR